jgi:hypothetical protein
MGRRRRKESKNQETAVGQSLESPWDGALSVAASPHLSAAFAAHALRRKRLSLDNWGPYAGIVVLPCHPLLLAVGVTARQGAGDEGEENNVSHWVQGSSISAMALVTTALSESGSSPAPMCIGVAYKMRGCR